jgi:hypothetical protein
MLFLSAAISLRHHDLRSSKNRQPDDMHIQV